MWGGKHSIRRLPQAVLVLRGRRNNTVSCEVHGQVNAVESKRKNRVEIVVAYTSARRRRGRNLNSALHGRLTRWSVQKLAVTTLSKTIHDRQHFEVLQTLVWPRNKERRSKLKRTAAWRWNTEFLPCGKKKKVTAFLWFKLLKILEQHKTCKKKLNTWYTKPKAQYGGILQPELEMTLLLGSSATTIDLVLFVETH